MFIFCIFFQLRIWIPSGGSLSHCILHMFKAPIKVELFKWSTWSHPRAPYTSGKQPARDLRGVFENWAKLGRADWNEMNFQHKCPRVWGKVVKKTGILLFWVGRGPMNLVRWKIKSNIFWSGYCSRTLGGSTPPPPGPLGFQIWIISVQPPQGGSASPKQQPGSDWLPRWCSWINSWIKL